MSRFPNSPALDTHAHIAPDVTAHQIATLNGAVVFAMTRDLKEAAQVSRRRDTTLIWGVGVHPGVSSALDEYSPRVFRSLANTAALIGEVGLDSRLPLRRGVAVFESILEECADQPLLVSVHTTGRTDQALKSLSRNPLPGVILHWFTGSPEQVDEAASLGSYFSINAAMSAEVIARMPRDRTLPETDFPSARRAIGARKPGDTTSLERYLGSLFGERPEELRARWHRNLNALLETSGARARLSADTARLLDTRAGLG